MAKKRMKKAVRRTAAHRTKIVSYSKTANVLTIISVFLLLFCAILLIFSREVVLEQMSKYGQSMTSSELSLIGLMWLLIAFFAWSINRTIKETHSNTSMWELFILSLVAIYFAWPFGLMMLAASVIYLVKARKKQA